MKKQMKAERIFETVIYANDLAKAKRFYADVLNLNLIRESELFLVFRLAQSVLLVFNPEISRDNDRQVPSHGTVGDGHIAFTASEEEMDLWKNTFEKHGIEIEKWIDWQDGGKSLYVRDPAGNSVEFAPATLWGGDWGFR